MLALVNYALYVGVLVAWHAVAGHACMAFSRRFQAIQPRHKVFYVVADLTKAAVLGGCMCTPTWWRVIYVVLVENVRTDPVVNEAVRHFALVYCATDLAQFVWVKMPRSTIQHHAATSAFGLYVALLAEPALYPAFIWALLWYGLCSTAAFSVNAYKALRVVSVAPWVDVLRRVAAATYAAELYINWPVYVWFGWRALQEADASWLALTAVLGFSYVIVTDDLALLQFLRARPTAAGPSATNLEPVRLCAPWWCTRLGLTP